MFRSHGSISSLVLLVIMVSMLGAQGVTQEYAQGKIFLSNGMTLEGKNLRMTMESVIIDVNEQEQMFLLSDVVQVMPKKGKQKNSAKTVQEVVLASCWVPG